MLHRIRGSIALRNPLWLGCSSSTFAALLFVFLCPMATGAEPQRIVIVGGGVAGVTCCQEVSAHLLSAREPAVGPTKVTLVAAKGLLKGVKNVVRLTRKLETFDIVDQASFAILSCPFPQRS